MRDQKENPNKTESCVKLSQIVKNCNRTGRGVEFDAIPGAPVSELSELKNIFDFYICERQS